MLLMLSCFGDRVQNQTKKDIKFINLNIKQSINNDLTNSIELKVEIPIKKLVFKKMIDHFNANLTIDVLIVDSSNKIIISESWNETVIKDFYEETKAFEDVILSYECILDYGEYHLNIILNDFENHINWVKNLDFIVEEKTGLSSLKALYKYENQFEVINYNNLNKIDTMWINYKVNNSELSDLSFDIEYLNVEFSDDFIFSNINSSTFDSDIISDKNKYKNNTISEEIVDSNQIIINKYKINKEQYVPVVLSDSTFNIIRINLSYKDEIKNIILNLIDYNNYDYNLSILIGPMYYLLDADYYEFESLSYDEKIIYIKDYWHESIHGDDLFKEFYKRVLYVNKKYDYLSTEGWESDRGRIYIINGAPEKISYEYNNQTEFEIWEYSNRHYVFINNYGDYELYNPNNP